MKYVYILFTMFIFFVSCNSKNKLDLDNYNQKYTEKLRIVIREKWGSIPNNSKFEEHTIKRITIHHGGVEFTDDKNPIEYLKNLQSWSRNEKKWMDIPYHFLIDLDGNIYEGRSLKYPGDTNTDYNPTGHLLICVLGNYEIQKINEDQLNSLIDLIVYFCHELDLNPNVIKGHKDYTETACPGKDLYKYIEDKTLKTRVEKKLAEFSN